MASVEQRPGPIAAGDQRRLLQEAAGALQSDRIRLAHELYGDALAAATTDETRAEALIGLGHVAHRSGRPREAVRLLEDALRLTEQEPWDRLDLADPIGRSYAAVGELERASTVFLQCVRRAQEEGDRLAHVRFAALLSYALTDQGKFEEAERALEEVLAAAAGSDDPDVRSLVEWAQARLRGEQGQTEAAVEHARAAFELLRTRQNTNFLALTYELLASLYNDLGRAEEALDLLRDGWPLLISSATPLQVAHYRIEEARALAALGQTEGAASGDARSRAARRYASGRRGTRVRPARGDLRPARRHHTCTAAVRNGHRPAQ